MKIQIDCLLLVVLLSIIPLAHLSWVPHSHVMYHKQQQRHQSRKHFHSHLEQKLRSYAHKHLPRIETKSAQDVAKAKALVAKALAEKALVEKALSDTALLEKALSDKTLADKVEAARAAALAKAAQELKDKKAKEAVAKAKQEAAAKAAQELVDKKANEAATKAKQEAEDKEKQDAALAKAEQELADKAAKKLAAKEKQDAAKAKAAKEAAKNANLAKTLAAQAALKAQEAWDEAVEQETKNAAQAVAVAKDILNKAAPDAKTTKAAKALLAAKVKAEADAQALANKIHDCIEFDNMLETCTDVEKPVCGYDNTGQEKNYQNACILCIHNKGIEYKNGRCVKDASPSKTYVSCLQTFGLKSTLMGSSCNQGTNTPKVCLYLHKDGRHQVVKTFQSSCLACQSASHKDYHLAKFTESECKNQQK